MDPGKSLSAPLNRKVWQLKRSKIYRQKAGNPGICCIALSFGRVGGWLKFWRNDGLFIVARGWALRWRRAPGAGRVVRDNVRNKATNYCSWNITPRHIAP